MMNRAPTYLRSAASAEDGGQFDEDADDDGADQGAEDGPEAAEGDAGEDQQQDLRAHVEGDAGAVVRPQDAAEGGEHAADNPDDADDGVHVDAGGRGQRGVVGHRPGGLAEPGLQQDEADQRR